MPKRTNEFQQLVFFVKQHVSEFAAVTESKYLIDRLTGARREVDIYIEAEIGGHQTTICIECRDHARKADVEWVEKMKGKHENLPTKHLVLVSRNGFTPEATKKASLWGFETLALESVDEEVVSRLFGNISRARAKGYTLTPKIVLVEVRQPDGLSTEKINVERGHAIYNLNGELVFLIQDLLDVVLKPGDVVDGLLPQAEENHNVFRVYVDTLTDTEGGPLCLQKLESEVLCPIESVTVLGSCEFKIGEFQLQHGKIGPTVISWGSGTVRGEKGMLVATEDGHGNKRITFNPTS